LYVYIGSPSSKLIFEHLRAAAVDYEQFPVYYEPSYKHERYDPLLVTCEQLRATAPLASANPSPGRASSLI